MATRAEVVAEARTWEGTRFHHQGRVRGVGVDCLNLVVAVAEAKGLVSPDFRWNDYPEYQGYGRSPNAPLLLSGCDRFMDRIEPAKVLPGDVLVFRFVTEAQHFAIVTGSNPTYIIHAYAQVRKVTEHRFDELWASRVVAAYRFRNITGN